MRAISDLFGVLDAPALLIAVTQIDQLLLLAGPESAHALAVQFDDPEAEESLVEHDDLVFVRVVVHHVT